jgi:hypothetical protein
MPRKKTHEDVTVLLLGESFSKIHELLDWPSKVLGPSHRKVLHSLPEAVAVGLILTYKVEGALAGALHVVTDVVDAGVKNEIRKIVRTRKKRR